MAVKYERIVEEDLNIGTGPVDVTMPGGGTVVGHRIGIQSFLAVVSIASMNGGQNITGGAAPAIVQLDIEEMDVADWFNPATFTFTPTVNGVYQVEAFLRLAAFTGIAAVAIFKNSSHYAIQEMARSGAVGQTTVSAQIPMNGSTDTLTLRVSHNDGSNLREVESARMSISIVGRSATV